MSVLEVSVTSILLVHVFTTDLTNFVLCNEIDEEVRLEGVIFEVITGIITQIIVFWEMTPSSSVNGFCRKLRSLSLILKMEAVDL